MEKIEEVIIDFDSYIQKKDIFGLKIKKIKNNNQIILKKNVYFSIISILYKRL